MNQNCFASIIQRLYRIIGNTEESCQLLDSVCKVLSNEEEFVFVWVELSEQYIKNKTICYSRGNIFKNPDCHLIAQHFSECDNLKKVRLNGSIHQINSDENDRCANVFRKYFEEKNSAAIFSSPIEYNNFLFGHFNILIRNLSNITKETQLLLKELVQDIAIKLSRINSDDNSQSAAAYLNFDKEKYLKTLLHCMYEDIIVIDKNYNIVDVNNSRLKIADKKTEEVLGAKCYTVSHGFDKPCNLYGEECPLQEVMKSGKSKQVRHKHLTDDGKMKYVDILFSPFTNENGEVEKVIETIRDVTEAVKIEEELKIKEFRLKQIAGSLDVVFFTFDINNSKPKITYLSEGFNKIWGIKRESALANQRLWFDAVDPEDRNKIFHLIREYVKTKNPVIQTEFRIVKPNDTIRWINIKTRVVEDISGNSKQIFGIAEDITEKKLLELELQNAYQKSRESINFKNYLLGNINHEIRTPLNAILGFTQILKEETPREAIDELTDKILFASNRLLNTLDSIIELSDLQSDSRKLQSNDLSIVELLKTVQHKFYPIAKEKNLLFEVVEPDQDVVIKSDEFLLKKILNQLLDNAFKYTNQGSVTLSVRFNKNENENWLIIDVADTGIGIEQEKLNTIFEAFRQGSEGLSRSYQGSGLGLTITKKMIELLKGKICVESEKGIGSRFSVHIPFEFTNKKFQVDKKENFISALEGKRILIVEDNPLNAEVLKHYLKSVVNTDIAYDSHQAFELSEKYLYDLILMDISLKNGESGIEVMKKMRFRDEYKSVPIVALTAFTFDEDKNKFIEEGFNGYIPKPIQRNELLNEINQYLR
ncbi:ATP-binding protein [Ignavibacterium sp.]|uniref:hybrid sensor histidine kinase/response regulator n=1 Tax=Ignavibacterium sp. TaxID=2651167 RepID=UPI00307D0E5D